VRLLGSPQMLSATSQTPLMHPRRPLAVLHWPLSGAMFGTPMPFGALGTQVWRAEHHWVDAQSVSTRQVVVQAPLEGSQFGPPG
jgi:hypothetical protein